jgi:hypothetical protein
MGDALNLVLAMDKKRNADTEAIGEGLNNFVNAFVVGRKLGIAQEGLDLKKSKAGTSQTIDQLKLINQLQTNQLMQKALSGSGGGATLGSIGPSGPTFDFITKEETLDRAFKLQDQFFKDQRVKDFQAIRTRTAQMDALLSSAKDGELDLNNALDQALISTFNKITDPTSVVRESEFARTEQNLPMLNRIIGSLAKFKQGGPGLTAEDRRDLVVAAKIIANESGKSFNSSIDRLSERATAFGVDPKTVTTGVERFSQFKISAGKAGKKNSSKSSFSLKTPQGRGYRVV